MSEQLAVFFAFFVQQGMLSMHTLQVSNISSKAVGKISCFLSHQFGVGYVVLNLPITGSSEAGRRQIL